MSPSCPTLIGSNKDQVQSPGALVQVIPKYSFKNVGDWIKPAGCLMDCTQALPTNGFTQTEEEKKGMLELRATG